jgi:hypothetical protein
MKSSLDAKGREVPDPKPLAIPMGYKRPETLQEQVQRLIRTSMSEYAALQGEETFEEADDFDIEDDPVDMSTPYEMEFDPVLGREVSPAEFAANAAYYRRLYEQASAREPLPDPAPPSSAEQASPQGAQEGPARSVGGETDNPG